MVGATGIEPVTPTMSTNGVDGNSSENRVLSAEKFAVRSRSDHPFLGRFMGEDDPPDPEMQSPAKAATEARALCKADRNTSNFNDDIAERQARHIGRFILVGYATAALVARLAFGVAR